MKNLKSKMKYVAGMLIGMIVAGGIGAYADYRFRAVDIKYTDEKNVSDALNDLYEIKNDLDTLNSNIAGTNAISSDVLTGKTAWGKDGSITGSMTNQGNRSFNGNTNITIPAGYYDGTGTVNLGDAYNAGKNENCKTLNNMTYYGSNGSLKNYEIGFEPSVVFLDFGSTLFLYGVKGDSTLYMSYQGNLYTQSGAFETYSTGFKMVSNVNYDQTCKMYAVK